MMRKTRSSVRTDMQEIIVLCAGDTAELTCRWPGLAVPKIGRCGRRAWQSRVSGAGLQAHDSIIGVSAGKTMSPMYKYGCKA